jgi:hypothetical protein
MPSTGWWRFVVWVLTGAFLSFAWATGFSIGLFLLPFALLALWLVARRGRIWPEVLGAFAGAGLIGLLVTSQLLAAQAMPWLVGSLVLTLGAPLAYAFLRRGIVQTG